MHLQKANILPEIEHTLLDLKKQKTKQQNIIAGERQIKNSILTYFLYKLM